ncbi:L-lactate dehydrogenase (cytochrome), partial [Phenoliferia sp. Uapishka_3]
MSMENVKGEELREAVKAFATLAKLESGRKFVFALLEGQGLGRIFGQSGGVPLSATLAPFDPSTSLTTYFFQPAFLLPPPSSITSSLLEKALFAALIPLRPLATKFVGSVDTEVLAKAMMYAVVEGASGPLKGLEEEGETGREESLFWNEEIKTVLLYRRTPIKLESNAGVEPPNSKPSPKMWAEQDVGAHRTKDDCWIILDGQVWDVTEFLEQHPGGGEVIVKHAGQDVSELFKPIHPPRTLEIQSGTTDLIKLMGVVDPATVTKKAPMDAEEAARIASARAALPPVNQVRSLREMEVSDDFHPDRRPVLTGSTFKELALSLLGKRAKIYYSGGSDDEVSLRDSFASFQRCRLRPRVLVNVVEIDPRTKILGAQSTLPIYIAPAAHARLGHELGEVPFPRQMGILLQLLNKIHVQLNLTRGASSTGIPQGISANASMNLSDLIEEKDNLVAAGRPETGLIYQIYINRDRKKTEQLMKEAVDGGVRGFFLTVDSPTLGNREADFREQGLAGSMDDKPHDQPNRDVFGYYDTSVTWNDLSWIKKHANNLPVYIKGVATVEDVALARQHGAAGVVLSNHGGRQLDCARSPMDTLLEIVDVDPTLTRDLEVYIDGGARRGTDVLKALCLGAKGVGLGRPFLYAQTAFGEQGVVRAVRIMENEIITGMRLLGARTLKDLKPEMVECLDSAYRIPGSKKRP